MIIVSVSVQSHVKAPTTNIAATYPRARSQTVSVTHLGGVVWCWSGEAVDNEEVTSLCRTLMMLGGREVSALRSAAQG